MIAILIMYKYTIVLTCLAYLITGIIVYSGSGVFLMGSQARGLGGRAGRAA